MHNTAGTWQARLSTHGVQRNLGSSFKTAADAALAHDSAAVREQGASVKPAKLNFPEQLPDLLQRLQQAKHEEQLSKAGGMEAWSDPSCTTSQRSQTPFHYPS